MLSDFQPNSKRSEDRTRQGSEKTLGVYAEQPGILTLNFSLILYTYFLPFFYIILKHKNQRTRVISSSRTYFLIKLGYIIMSFRWNISRDVSDRSFFTQGNELIATSIGVTGNRSALSCRLNMDQKDVKYCRTEE